MSSTIVCTDLSFSWPDGSRALNGLDVAFGPGRTGLIGVNGAGKTTLLRLIAGELTPSSGSVRTRGDVGYLPQALPLKTGDTVADVLGIAAVVRAIEAVERGEATEENFGVIGDDWDVEERARGELDRLGLADIDLARPVGTLSGGETIMIGLAAQFVRRPDILLLDEPTNNLDARACDRLYAAVVAWPRVLLVVSHDRALLEAVDQIADLSDGKVRVFGGNLSAYEEVLATEREAAVRAVRTAEADVRRERRDLVETQVKLTRRVRYGKKMYENNREPRIVMNARKRAAQVSAGKLRDVQSERLDAARERLAEAEDAAREAAEIRVDLPGTRVPAGRVVLTVSGVEPLGELILRGPERVALTGPNGAGKTTLLRAVRGEPMPGVTVRVGVDGVGYLPQRLDVLDDGLSVVDNVRATAPTASTNEIRAGLARFLFRGASPDRPAGTLSGGERFRAVLATLLLARPEPQLLLLDEPTNNLDTASVRHLSTALEAYRGALVVVSHDPAFLDSIGITRRLELDRETGLTEVF